MYRSEDIQNILRECAVECILPYFQNLKKEHIGTKAHDQDFVTDADKASEQYLIRHLTALVPDSIVLGEEDFFVHGFDPKGAAGKDVWIIDPIDGTKNFVNGRDNFCILLAHAHKGHFMGAWIYAPRLNQLVSWKSGEAVTLNGSPITLDTHSKKLGEMVVGGHILHHVAKNYAEHKEIVAENRKMFSPDFLNVGSLGIETLWMVQNRADVVSFGRLSLWDFAPCAALITAMGGKAQKIDGQKLEGEALFNRKGAFLATRSLGQWAEVRDAILKDIPWREYFV